MSMKVYVFFSICYFLAGALFLHMLGQQTELLKQIVYLLETK